MIIFLELGEVSKIQTTPKLSLHSLFQIYPSGYNKMRNLSKSDITISVQKIAPYKLLQNTHFAD